MSETKKSVFTDLFFGLVLAVGVVWLNREQEFPLLHKLCDGFFVAAVLLLGVGGLKWARNKGTFDMIVFGVKSAINITLPWLMANSEHRDEDLMAYKERKQEKWKPAKDLLISGAVFMAISLILLVIYLSMY